MRRSVAMAAIWAAALVFLIQPRSVPAQQTGGSAASETRESEHFASPALGRDLLYSLYLPPGYGQGDARYPTLYLLHGVNGNHLEWLHDGRVRDTLDTLIRDRRIAPMIVVMPEGENSWYVDSKGVGGPGDYEMAIADELVEHVDATLRTKAGPRHRGIGGLSMGGFGALRMAFRQPFRFVAAASFSGAFWARLTPDSQLGDWSDRIFKGSFGRPFDARRFLALSPLTTVETVAAAKNPPAVYLAVADHDRFKLYLDTFQLFQHMRELDLPVEMRMSGGDHDWETWASELPDAVLFFDRQFRDGE